MAPTKTAAAQNLNSLRGVLEKMEKEVGVHGRHEYDAAVVRFQQLQLEYRQLREAVERVLTQDHLKAKYAREREQLLAGGAAAAAAASGHADTRVVDTLTQEHDSLNRSSRALDDVIGSATGILQSLKDQGSILKGVRRKLLDITTALGVSSTLQGVIQRRTTGDKMIVYSGMVLTLVVFLLCYRWLTATAQVIPGPEMGAPVPSVAAEPAASAAAAAASAAPMDALGAALHAAGHQLKEALQEGVDQAVKRAAAATAKAAAR